MHYICSSIAVYSLLRAHIIQPPMSLPADGSPTGVGVSVGVFVLLVLWIVVAIIVVVVVVRRRAARKQKRNLTVGKNTKTRTPKESSTPARATKVDVVYAVVDKSKKKGAKKKGIQE